MQGSALLRVEFWEAVKLLAPHLKSRHTLNSMRLSGTNFNKRPESEIVTMISAFAAQLYIATLWSIGCLGKILNALITAMLY